MTQSRRSFLKTTGIAASGLLASALPACKSAKGAKNLNRNFGLQLYTLRDDLPKDPTGVLKQVATFGYKEIESFEGAQGMFWGLGNTGFKRLMDDLGMTLVSSHCNVNADFERKAAEAAAIGMKYLISPYVGPQKSLDDYKRIADSFNQRGEVCKKNGLHFAYHNHDYSFKPLDGRYPQDVLMQNTDKDLVDYEMDMYWVVTAGQDPSDWYKKYPNRFRLCHVKDRQKNVPLTEKDNASVVVGTGSIDYPAHLKTGIANGLRHFIVEQEAYAGTTPLAAVKANADYMKTVSL